MRTPFRNTDRTPPIYPARSVVSIFDRIEDAEAIIKELDTHDFGNDVIYARDEEARKLVRNKNRGWFARLYRALQAVMSDELSTIKRYEEKIAAGSSFILIPLPDSNDLDRVAAILKAHHVNLAHYLSRTSFRKL